MGPYLAQPNKEKARYKAENAKLKLRFGRCEMQGTPSTIQAGGALWRTQPSRNWTSGMATLSSACSTATVVLFPTCRARGLQIRLANLPHTTQDQQTLQGGEVPRGPYGDLPQDR
jgi:hypothetical protein